MFRRPTDFNIVSLTVRSSSWFALSMIFFVESAVRSVEHTRTFHWSSLATRHHGHGNKAFNPRTRAITHLVMVSPSIALI